MAVNRGSVDAMETMSEAVERCRAYNRERGRDPRISSPAVLRMLASLIPANSPRNTVRRAQGGRSVRGRAVAPVESPGRL